jgi:hypothetical protein
MEAAMDERISSGQRLYKKGKKIQFTYTTKINITMNWKSFLLGLEFSDSFTIHIP